ncbi:MAG TPA: DUF4389 domain-containing protein [Spirochaetia bacterium]|nr:DUF4389 domain-containing protein [Spirochaetia bacterium]
MKLSITRQESYSRGELLLRTLFGWVYIAIPHGFLLFFLGIWSAILAFVTFWIVLFTGSFPQSIFEYQYKLMKWSLRLQATMFNLVDGYPAFGLDGTSEKVTLELEKPEKVNQGMVIVRALFGFIYVMIPHGFCLYFRMIGTAVLAFLGWWAVLFTGKYPEKWHGFNVGTFRWALRISLYLGYFTDLYPTFSGKE